MKTHPSVTAFTTSKQTVVTIGTFDGVHLGHQKIIRRLLESAHNENLTSVVLTFFPHPRMVLQKDTQIQLINTIDERAALLDRLGLDHLVIHPFTREFSRLDAEVFVEEILVKQLQTKKVIIGYDHRFGRNRSADIHNLKAFGDQYGFTVEEISKQELEDVAISSTKVRKALEEGAIEKANNYLGAPILLTGTVITGKKLGRTLGYPTANLDIKENYKLIPANGVYVVSAYIEDVLVYGMMNIGTNPTVGGTQRTIETYFFNFEGDLYDKTLQIRLHKRLRDEKKFDALAELIRAMRQDEKAAKAYIETH